MGNEIMRKLRDAEARFLCAIPPETGEYNGHALGGVLWPWDRPKRTNSATIRNLYDLGLIEPAPMPIEMYALRLTEAGRRALYERGFK